MFDDFDDHVAQAMALLQPETEREPVARVIDITTREVIA